MNVAAGMLNARLPVDPSLLGGRRVGCKVDPLLDGSCQLRLHRLKVLTLHSIHGRQRQELWSTSGGEQWQMGGSGWQAMGRRRQGWDLGIEPTLTCSKLVCCGLPTEMRPTTVAPETWPSSTCDAGGAQPQRGGKVGQAADHAAGHVRALNHVAVTAHGAQAGGRKTSGGGGHGQRGRACACLGLQQGWAC